MVWEWRLYFQSLKLSPGWVDCVDRVIGKMLLKLTGPLATLHITQFCSSKLLQNVALKAYEPLSSFLIRCFFLLRLPNANFLTNVFKMNFPSRRYHSGKEVQTLQGLELVQTMPNSKLNKNFHIK